MLDEGEKLNRIEDMKSKLNNKNYEAKIEHHNSFVYKIERDVPDSWGERKKNGSFFLSRFRDSDPGPFPYHGNALPTELKRHIYLSPCCPYNK